MKRRGNPFTSSATGGRVLSALQLPLFAVRPPPGYGIRGGLFAGVARELRDGAERREAMAAYCEEAGWFTYLEYTMWRSGRPTADRIRALHRSWLASGSPLVGELRRMA